MLYTSPSPRATAHVEQAVLSPRRIGISKRLFWLLFALEALIIGSVCLGTLLAVLPDRTPLVATTDYLKVREAVLERLNGTVDDPLINIAPGVMVRSSNVRGFVLNGTTYYYYVEGERNFDPLSRADVRPDQVEIVLSDHAGPTSFVLYRVISK